MSFDNDAEAMAGVYGELYASAQTRMDLLNQAVVGQSGKGFKNAEECAVWAHDHKLDIIVSSVSQHRYFNVTHKGGCYIEREWYRGYEDILYWMEPPEKEGGQWVKVPWKPKGSKYFNVTRVVGEQPKYGYLPLEHRDYFTPTGYYDDVTGTFNRATPYPAFAKETGRDTAHLYRYINAIAGECAPYLLRWLQLKIMYPKKKTEIVPIFVSRKQGTGKTTFGEVICKGIFGRDNVLVTDQFDASARFNADNSDALIVCAEEKEEDDKRNTVATFKSRSTSTTVRKEHKGVDPVYQDSYTEFVITSNKDVPLKFDGTEKQRRFMVMGVDPEFTRDNPEADAVFSKLYGVDGIGRIVGTPFVNDTTLQQQFMHEIVQNDGIRKLDLRSFPITPEYQRCLTQARTTEHTEIDAILRTLAPFIKKSLVEKRIVTEVDTPNGALSLANFMAAPSAMQYVPAFKDFPDYIAICRPLVFYDQNNSKPFTHAVVERGILDCGPWLLTEYGIRVIPNQLPLAGGFTGVMNRYRQAPAARFTLEVATRPRPLGDMAAAEGDGSTDVRIGTRLRVNSQWAPDVDGEYETVNEMKPGIRTLENKNNNVQYMDTFLFEADDVDSQTYSIEQARLERVGVEITAASLFLERLRLQRAEADRLVNAGIARRVVYSGGKSYHIMVRVADAPKTLEEYKWLHAHLCDGVLSKRLDFDATTCDPGRLTRAPISKRRTFMYQGIRVVGEQGLYRQNKSAVYDYNWRPLYEQWRNRPPEKWETMGRKLRPCKQEYKDAMWALLTGTFWTDGTWDGRRQRCFFPAYRLCRLLGYTHDQLWCAEGIMDGIDQYYRRNERDYWRSREGCDLVREIDSEVSAQLESELKGL